MTRKIITILKTTILIKRTQKEIEKSEYAKDLIKKTQLNCEIFGQKKESPKIITPY